MRNSILVSILAVALTLSAACGGKHAGMAREGATESVAEWRIDEDANLAYPVCGNCGTLVEDRSAAACASCGTLVHVEAKTIPCPECEGSKSCIHCGAKHACTACLGSQKCAICEGTGRWHGENCPECEGARICPDCSGGPNRATCDRCDGTHVCANCDGEGTITLR